ncbi:MULTISPECIES: helix-turn-helix domain-containing protein [Sphingobacterium]|uniref:helix-turn-helix domain-containing protein n=1 Tax=Sphingobacterium TaxID=28453 RepID=UPI0013D916EB|nr:MULTISPECIES: helix-turn-helix domain-containing protein [unclassified Sphingobacterium]
MIRSFHIHFGDLNPDSTAESRLPRDISFAIAYAQSRSWYDKDNWYSIQWYNAKHVYLYSIEIETKRKLQIPIKVSYPDIHWQYALKGGYSLKDDHGAIPVLSEDRKHLIRGQKENFDIEVGQGRHWIVGFNVAASWLDRYPEDLSLGSALLPHELARDTLYQSVPSAITDQDRAELYYLLGLCPGRHILQDSQIYVPVSNLVEQMRTLDDPSLSPIQNKIQAVKYYIQKRIAKNQPVPPISVLANRFYVDKDYLGRTYRSTEKEGLAHYIYRLKHERAAELLSNKVAVSTIAEQLGYSDSAAFRKAFKKYHKVYPSAYIPTQH